MCVPERFRVQLVASNTPVLASNTPFGGSGYFGRGSTDVHPGHWATIRETAHAKNTLYVPRACAVGVY